MQFTAPAEHYDRFMGRYTPTLAGALVDATGVAAAMRVLDVGCGPGGLTRELVSRVGVRNRVGNRKVNASATRSAHLMAILARGEADTTLVL
jgi:trans-aconitate methyltransferase